MGIPLTHCYCARSVFALASIAYACDWHLEHARRIHRRLIRRNIEHDHRRPGRDAHDGNGALGDVAGLANQVLDDYLCLLALKQLGE